MSQNLSEIVGHLKECNFFSLLSHSELVDIAHHFKKLYLTASDILFHQGDESIFFYILLKGKLVSYLNISSNHYKMVGTIDPIETVGELGVLSGEVRSLSVSALNDSELLVISSEIFKEICHKYPRVLSEISKLITQRSLQAIKIISNEEKRRVAMVFSLTKEVSFNYIESQYQKYCLKDDMQIFSNLNSDKVFAHLRKNGQIKQAIILMEAFDKNLFLSSVGNVTHFYFIVSSQEKSKQYNHIQEIFKKIENAFGVRLELIILHPDHTKEPKETMKWLKLADFSLHHHVRLNHSEDWERLSRFIRGKAFALVLGGGAAKGMAHMGVIKAFSDKKIPIDAICGASVGAGIAACYALERNYESSMEHVTLVKEAISNSLFWRRIIFPAVSLFSSRLIAEVLKKIFESRLIENLWIPYRAVSSNLSAGKEVIHNTGLIWEAVLSSGTIPGIFPPVVKKGQLIVDGGLLNNLPVNVMRNMIGSQNVIVSSMLSARSVNSNYHYPSNLNLWESILLKLPFFRNRYCVPSFTQTFISALLLGAHHKEIENSLTSDILIYLNLSQVSFLFLTKAQEQQLLEMGYSKAIKEIEAYLTRDK